LEVSITPKRKTWCLLAILLLCIVVPLFLMACDSEEAGEQVGEGIAKGQEEAKEFGEGVKKGYEDHKGSGCAAVIVPFLLVAAAIAFKHKLV
jgi:hypothetical protein